jgi:thiol-disulfide isomerase/thioredoxin
VRLAALLSGAAALLASQARLTPLDESAYRGLVASSKGQVVIADFWATWCIPCRAEMPQLVSLEARYRARGVKLITVSCDEPDQEAGAFNFLRKHGVPQPGYIKRAANDEKFIDSVDPKWSGALPGLFVYDRQGRLVKSFIGETDMATLEAVLKKLL